MTVADDDWFALAATGHSGPPPGVPSRRRGPAASRIGGALPLEEPGSIRPPRRRRPSEPDDRGRSHRVRWLALAVISTVLFAAAAVALTQPPRHTASIAPAAHRPPRVRRATAVPIIAAAVGRRNAPTGQAVATRAHTPVPVRAHPSRPRRGARRRAHRHVTPRVVHPAMQPYGSAERVEAPRARAIARRNTPRPHAPAPVPVPVSDRRRQQSPRSPPVTPTVVVSAPEAPAVSPPRAHVSRRRRSRGSQHRRCSLPVNPALHPGRPHLPERPTPSS